MKKIYLLFTLIPLSYWPATAQTHAGVMRHLPGGQPAAQAVIAPESKQPSFGAERNRSTQYTNDVIIRNDPSTNQRSVSIATAFNGWIYAAFSTQQGTSGGFTACRSKDGGQTWTTLFSYSSPNCSYPVIKLAVAGNDTNSLYVFIAGVLYNTSPLEYVAWADRYDGRTGAFLDEFVNDGDAEKIYDIAVTTDNLSPSFVSSPFSVGIAYTKYTMTADSVIYTVSIDGGITTTNRQVVMTAGSYLRHISIAYGKSSIYSNGRYFLAFETRLNNSADVGHIVFAYTINDPTSSFSAPVYIDSAGSGMTNNLRNPQVSCSVGNFDSDSNGVSTVVLVDRKYSATDFDILGLYSLVTVYGSMSNWHRLNVDNTTNYCMESSVAFNPNNHHFACTYFDSTQYHLMTMDNDYNLASPGTWSPISMQYNDQTNNLVKPWPVIAVNTVTGHTACAWNSEGAASNGVSLFDSEDLGAGIPTASLSGSVQEPYPDPADATIIFRMHLSHAPGAQLEILNVLGQQVLPAVYFGTQSSTDEELPVDISSLENGVYIYRLIVGQQAVSGRFIVQHH